MRIISLALCAVALLVSTAAGAPCPSTASGTKYSVKIESSPPGGTVYINDKSCMIGTTPFQGKLLAGDNAIIVELAGYEVATRTVKVARSRKLQEFFLPLTKKADPPKIDVKADAD